MPDHPRRVTPGEISDLLDQARSMSPAAPLAEQVTYYEKKARLLSRLAADLHTAEAHLVAADAWTRVRVLAGHRDHHPTASGVAS